MFTTGAADASGRGAAYDGGEACDGGEAGFAGGASAVAPGFRGLRKLLMLAAMPHRAHEPKMTPKMIIVVNCFEESLPLGGGGVGA